MTVISTRVAAAWYQLTGLRFKGRINAHLRSVHTPYGKYEYRTRLTPTSEEVYFPNLEGAVCPIQPCAVDDIWEDRYGNVQCEGPALPPVLPPGYKAFQWVDGIAIATRCNGVQVVMGNQ